MILCRRVLLYAEGTAEPLIRAATQQAAERAGNWTHALPHMDCGTTPPQAQQQRMQVTHMRPPTQRPPS